MDELVSAEWAAKPCPDGCGDSYHIVHDERIMPDGRPVYAWAFEISDLRRRAAEFEGGDEYQKMQNLSKVLGITHWAFERSPADLSDHLHVRFTDSAKLRATTWSDLITRAEIVSG